MHTATPRGATGMRMWKRLRRPRSVGRWTITLGLTALAVVVLAGVVVSASRTTGRPAAGGGESAPSALKTAPAASGGQVGATSAGAPMPAPAVGAPAPAAAARPSAAGDSALNVSTSAAEQSTQPLDRMIMRSAQLTIEVSDMESALAQARAIAARGGGFVSASTTRVERVNDQDRTVADLTIQVRSASADASISDLRALGKVTGESTGSQDVTEEYIDLDSNLRNLQASESAILKLLDKATRIEDVLSLQRELTNVRGQIERIQGRKRYLERRTDMATITLALRLPPLEGARPSGTGAWDPAAVAARGWQASLALLRGVADAFIIAIAFSWWLIPFVIAAGYVYLHRRRPGHGPATLATEV